MQKKKSTEQENAELKYRGLIEKRNEYNQQAKEFADTRNTLNNEKRDCLEEIFALRADRGTLVDKIRDHKKIRNAFQQKARELIEVKKGKRKNIHPGVAKELEALRAELKMMDVKQQTVPLSLQDENELLDTMRKRVKEIERLEKLMNEQESIISQVKNVDGSITELFKRADEEHAKVVELSGQAQELSDRITIIFKSVTHLTVESQKNHESYLKMREKADEQHQKATEMREKLMAMRNVKRDEIREARQQLKEQNRAVRDALYDKKKLDKAAEEALETLLKKGKVEIK